MPLTTAMWIRKHRHSPALHDASHAEKENGHLGGGGGGRCRRSSDEHLSEAAAATCRHDVDQETARGEKTKESGADCGSDTEALVRLAETAIAEEVRAYFFDMNACKELEKWGRTGVEEAAGSMRSGSAGDLVNEEGLMRSSAAASPPRRRPRLSLTQQLLRDIVVDTVQSERDAPITLSLNDGMGRKGGREDAAAPHRHEPSRQGSREKHFDVSVASCATEILTTLPCAVLHGYVVMWAETTVGVHVTPTATAARAEAIGAVAHGEEERSSGVARDGADRSFDQWELAQVLQLLPPRSRRNGGVGDSSRGAPPRTRPPSLAPDTRQPARGSPSRARRSPKDGELREDLPTGSLLPSLHHHPQGRGIVLLRFHSLHLVHRSTLTHPRRSSFALQSIFQVPAPKAKTTTPAPRRHAAASQAERQRQALFRCATSLECYPRHVIHFGLPAHALWSPASGLLRRGGMGERLPCLGPVGTDPAEGEPAARRRGRGVLGRSPAALSAAARAASVLILGLGGNVLGRCLNAILPQEVNVDVVELEPAVVEACLRHGQIPPLSSSSSLVPPSSESNSLGGKTRSRASSAEVARRVHPQQHLPLLASDHRVMCFPRSPLHPATAPAASTTALKDGAPVGKYVFYTQDAAEFLDPRTQLLVPGACPHSPGKRHTASCEACRRSCWDVIILDCYDPEREAMMFGGGLVDRCRSRLHPSGGCLLVNAHVLPKRETLVEDFLRRGFSAVQALRVAGCDQSVIACFVGNDAEGQRSSRFTRANVQAVCEELNQHAMGGGPSASSCMPGSEKRERRDTQRTAFLFDSTWMKSCRPLSVAGTATPSPSPRRRRRSPSRKRSKPERRPAAAAHTDRCCCVWEHGE